MAHPHRQRGEEGAIASLQPQEAEDIWLVTKNTQNFYRCTIESILSGCITAWYGNCSAHKRKALQRVVRSAQRITGGKLPALQDTYTTRCYRKAIKDNNHPSHCLFTQLSSRRRGQYRCIKAGTERLKNSFYLKAIRLLNSQHTDTESTPATLIMEIDGKLCKIYH